MSERMTIREACRHRQPLDGADAQALEGALAQAERDLASMKGDLRDRFAMAALTGMLADNTTGGEPEKFATAAYQFADAMIAERGKK